tara:strand:- start:64 stop:231 length:168 start_codon:yes stop_codon:yes gene_type:complete
MENEILSVVYLLLVLILIIPGFLYANKNKKNFFKNLFIWFGVILFIIICVKFFYQ